MADSNASWKKSLESKDAFNHFITNYFKDHKELTGHYDDPSYYEYYVVRLDSKDGLIISLTTGLNSVGTNTSPLPFKDKEKISIEEFRQLILNKKFADENMSLADVFQIVAGLSKK
ncbi:hypothetical protein [Lentilactobacillus hilgardii]|uniref:hypothetical protein n=1 Tax=Lentilactobacillus hilgardii TaxID=1588 RepID=UPI0021A4D20F|nr:hypothetical protein [Lentilactobacillus hilgardii]MCT3399579.1 hypothetical protein [Lentilactobacillus hilgardii]